MQEKHHSISIDIDWKPCRIKGTDIYLSIEIKNDT